MIPRALAGLTNDEEAGDETSGVVNDDEDDDGDEDDVQSTAAITDECPVTFEDLCNEEREDTNKWKPDPVERFTQSRLNSLMSQQTEATWRGKCRWWDERPRWDSDQLRANKLLTQVFQDAQGTTPVLGVPKQKKVFDIDDVPWRLRPLLKAFQDIFPDTLPHGLPP